MKKIIDINGIQNAETYLTNFFSNRRIQLDSLTIEGSKISFVFGDLGNIYLRIVAKQYSKKKYSDAEFRNNISKIQEQSNGLRLKGIAETDKIWLAIFAKYR